MNIVDVFGATSTTDEVLSGMNLQGKRILVTGVSAGLGIETARSLAAHGAARRRRRARFEQRPKRRPQQVRKDAATAGGSFELVALDLANLKSVRACADELLAKGQFFDVVIANAGVMATPFGHTADGFETQFGTNHLGHFVLINRIAPLLRKGSRVINLSSAGHRFSNVDLNDPNFERTAYDPFVAYGRSKTANILFAVAFDRRHRARGRACRRCASGSDSNRTRPAHGPEPPGGHDRTDERSARRGREGAVPMEVGSARRRNFCVGGVVAPADEIGGKYCENCHVGEIVADSVTISGVSEGVRGYALDQTTRKRCGRKAKKWSENLFRASKYELHRPEGNN